MSQLLFELTSHEKYESVQIETGYKIEIMRAFARYWSILNEHEGYQK